MESLREVLKARDPEDESKLVNAPSSSKKNPEEKSIGKEEGDGEGEKQPQVYTDSSTFLKVLKLEHIHS